MSYDVQIWSVNPITPDDVLLADEKLFAEELGWTYRTKNWQIVIGSSDRVLEEDLPEGIDALLPGISYVADLMLEPIHAPQSAHDKLASMSKRLAKESRGIVLDQQTGTFQTPTGLKRYTPQKREERFSILSLSWWFTDGPLLTKEGIVEFIDLLEKQLPEALPRRYGLFEPPQYEYSSFGKEHLIDFIYDNRESIVVWYPSRPVVYVHLTRSNKWGMNKQGFKSNYLKVEIEKSVLDQPGWFTTIMKFWKSASLIIRPFYGDVRTINNVLRSRSTYSVDGKTDFHPVRGPWWKGIPRKLGHAAVLGSPYISKWSKFENSVQSKGNLAFITNQNWKDKKDVAKLIGGVPKNIAQRKTPKRVTTKRHGFRSSLIEWNTEYPSVWPF